VSTRDVRERLDDILTSIAAIRRARRQLDVGGDPELVHDAVLHRFTVIGEAVGQLPDDVREQEPEIPWNQIKDLRNFIAHSYFEIQIDQLWQIVESDLGPLDAACNRLLHALPGGALRGTTGAN
jgi:uncharacterized protein with HEPN domain